MDKIHRNGFHKHWPEGGAHKSCIILYFLYKLGLGEPEMGIGA
jgi:hypothetical protein